MIERALNELPREEWPVSISEIPDAKLAAKILGRILVIERVNASHLVSVTLYETAPQGVEEIINSLMQTLVAVEREELNEDSSVRLLDLTKEKSDIEAEITSLSVEKADLAEKVAFHSYEESNLDPIFSEFLAVQNNYFLAADDLKKKQAAITALEQEYSETRQ